MCPRFHVDKVRCRLVNSYAGDQGLADDVCGLYQHPNEIKQLKNGDVALLKGERWHGNEGGGLHHRSPALAPPSNHLLPTLDFMS